MQTSQWLAVGLIAIMMIVFVWGDSATMSVAIGTGSDFLTPIGHRCNTVVMSPGGYRFGDYWRLGLPLSDIVVLASVPMLLLVWPT